MCYFPRKERANLDRVIGLRPHRNADDGTGIQNQRTLWPNVPCLIIKTVIIALKIKILAL